MMASTTDFDFPSVIVTRTNVMIRVHCTEDMILMIDNIRRACSTNIHIDINNTTDFEIQNENKTSTIAAHTIAKDWANTMNNVFNSETNMQDNYGIITNPTKETIIDNLGDLFTLENGKPHKVSIAISGISIAVTTLSILGLICCWWKNPTCANKLWANCHTTCKTTQETKKARIVDNILNQIQQELNSNLEAPIDDPNRQVPPPPLPPDIQM